MKKICFVLFLTFTMTAFGQTDTTMKEFDSNFAHVVYFWLEKPDSEDDRAAFETSLKKFLKNSAFAKTKFVGIPPAPSREVVDGSFTYSLIVTFESAEAQKGYQDEAPHKLFIEESSKLWTKVIVYDSKEVN